jgi:hypothetical protein
MFSDDCRKHLACITWNHGLQTRDPFPISHFVQLYIFGCDYKGQCRSMSTKHRNWIYDSIIFHKIHDRIEIPNQFVKPVEILGAKPPKAPGSQIAKVGYELMKLNKRWTFLDLCQVATKDYKIH